jgi:hypothetical protein
MARIIPIREKGKIKFRSVGAKASAGQKRVSAGGTITWASCNMKVNFGDPPKEIPYEPALVMPVTQTKTASFATFSKPCGVK